MSNIFPTPEFDTTRSRISLDGMWAFSYDPDGIGEREDWFAADKGFLEHIEIPGCSQAHPFDSAGGYERNTDVAIPENSRTIMARYGCMHPSWYQRKFAVPEEWRGQQIHLHIGGVKPAAEIWINGHRLGETLTSRSPVRCDLTSHINFGQENVLTVRIHWPRFRLDGVYDVWHAWSGLYRSVWIEAVAPVHVADIYIRPAINPPCAIVNIQLRGELQNRELRVVCEISGDNGQPEYSGETSATAHNATSSIEIPMPGAKLWNTWEPNLYQAKVRLYNHDELLDEASLRFGLREVSVDGFHVLLNGTPIFLRGGCDDHIYPDTVCPPADKAVYLDRIGKAKQYGFNYTKSAVDIYFREYLDAADELGYLVCQEMPFGAQEELRALRDDPPAELSDLWQRELVNIITTYRSHASVAFFSMSSELDINLENDKEYYWFCKTLPQMARQLAPDALLFDVTAGFCWSNDTRYGPREMDVIEDVLPNSYSFSPLNGRAPVPDAVAKPFFMHEWNWTTSLPNPDIIERYENSPLVPPQVPEMIELARTQSLLEELPTMYEGSRQLKHVLRKDALEQAYAHPKVAGYHHWLIHDVAYCPEGVFNEFWDYPADVPPEEFRTYNNDTVLVIEDNDRRDYFFGQSVPIGLKIVHFGPQPLHNASVRWYLKNGDTVAAQGVLPVGAVACGQRLGIASLSIAPLPLQQAATFDLVCELWDNRNKIAWNHWTLWFFPRIEAPEYSGRVVATQPLPYGFGRQPKPYDPLVPPPNTRVFFTHRLDDCAGEPVEGVFNWIEAGGHLLLLSHGVLREAFNNFYRTMPYNMGSVGNMGTVIHKHPALGDFPHEGWCDLSFLSMIQGAYPISLDPFQPQRIKPIIRSNGHQVTMDDKAYLFEAGMGEGVILVCSLNLQPQCHVYPAAQYLMHCLLKYLANGDCAPEVQISPDQLKAAMKR